jgi:centrosomal protein CEP112
LQQKEIDLKLKMADNQFQEEKLQLQAQHDRQLKEMLDHKNTEIEIVKAESRQKVQDAELTMEALERKVNQLEKESQHVREHKDKQMNELKTKVQQKIQDLTSDLDARLEEAAVETERQKLTLKQKNTRQMQELVEETNERLRRMEAEYSTQSENKDEVIKELEGQVKRLRQDIEQAVSTANRVAKDKVL